MSRLFPGGISLVALLRAVTAFAQSPSPPAGNTEAGPGTKVSPLPAPDASTQRGQGAPQGANQPAPPPSTSTYMQTETDRGTQAGSTVPGSPVSPVPAPDATTAPAQERQNSDTASGERQGGGITERK
jgi:hypothetical protein